MVRKARLQAEADLNTKKFDAGMARMRGGVKRFSALLGPLKTALAGAFSVAAITRAATAALEYASVLTDVTTQLNINVEAFQVLSAAMVDAGGTQKNLSKALVTLKKSIGQAEGGLVSYVREFENLGLKIEDLLELPLEKQLEALARGFVNTKNEAVKFSAIAILLGGRSTIIREALEELGTDGFEKLDKRIRETNRILGAETADRLDKTVDDILEFKRNALVIIGEYLGGVLKLKESLDDIKNFQLGSPTEFIREFAKLRTGEPLIGPLAKIVSAILPGEAPAAAAAAGAQQGADPFRNVEEQIKIWKELFDTIKEGKKSAQDYDTFVRQSTEAEIDRRHKVAQEAKGLLEAQEDLTKQAEEQIKQASAVGLDVPTDELARIGGFVGGVDPRQAQTDREIQIAMEQTRILKDSDKKLAAIKVAIEAL